MNKKDTESGENRMEINGVKFKKKQVYKSESPLLLKQRIREAVT